MANPSGNPSRVGVVTRRAAVGAMAAGGLGFVAFGPRRAEQAPAGRVVIDYWEKWTGNEGDAMRRIVDAFNGSQDRIWVRYFSMSAIEQKALVAIAGGSPPDLLGLWSFSQPQFVESGALIPVGVLDEAFGSEVASAFRSRYGDEDFRVRRELYAPQVWELMHYRGVQGGVVNTYSTMALYYDRNAFSGAGMDPDRPPRTIAELDEASDRLTVADASGKITRVGFIHREPGWWNWIWGYHFGGSLYDPERDAATADSPENVRAFEWLQTYPEKFGSSRLVQFQSGFGNYFSAQQPLLAGKVAMCIHGPYLANIVAHFRSSLDYGAAPFPVEESVYDPERPIALIESDLLCVPRGCPHPREAYEFLCFTQRPEQAEELARAHAKPSPLAEPSAGFVRTHPNRWITMHNALARSPRAFPKPPTRVWQEYESEFNAVIASLWERRVGARAALEEIQRRATAYISTARQKHERRYGDRPLEARQPGLG